MLKSKRVREWERRNNRNDQVEVVGNDVRRRLGTDSRPGLNCKPLERVEK